MGSTRLPGKVLMELAGKPVLKQVFHQLSFSKLINKMVLATTVDHDDDRLEEWAKKNSIEYFRGSVNDVLDRYYQAAQEHNPDYIVRITADCPLIDPDVVDRVIEEMIQNSFDYVSNTNPPTFPDGLDVEVFTFKALQHAWEKATLASEREHVTLFIRNHLELYNLGNVENPEDLNTLRWTLDHADDYKLISKIYSELFRGDKPILLKEALAVTKQYELGQVNKHLQRNEGLFKSLKNDKKVK
jgi:spore coat polysaccharide biosynthesis protein SpsF (cytidylyltransferase family)